MSDENGQKWSRLMVYQRIKIICGDTGIDLVSQSVLCEFKENDIAIRDSVYKATTHRGDKWMEWVGGCIGFFWCFCTFSPFLLPSIFHCFISYVHCIWHHIKTLCTGLKAFLWLIRY